ncbi:MAG: inner membrane protein [Cocleimonas sp.]|jgi:inner membrane protein
MMFRVFALMLLLTLMIIPITMLKNMVDERIIKEQTTIGYMTKDWGNEQTIIGPILSIPYVERIRRIESQTDSNGVNSSVSRDVFSNKTLMLLPENLSIKAELKDKLLKNDKFMTNVYQGEIELSGNFDLDALPEPSGNNSIEWDKAFIAIGLNDNKSVEASTPLRWEGSTAAFKPGTQLPKLIKNGIHASLEEVATENPRPKF